MPASPNTARLEARISTSLHSMLKRAADLQGRTMTDFVVAAVREAAERAIERSEIIQLSRRDQACFAKAMLEPADHPLALKRAFHHRNKLLRSD